MYIDAHASHLMLYMQINLVIVLLKVNSYVTHLACINIITEAALCYLFYISLYFEDSNISILTVVYLRRRSQIRKKSTKFFSNFGILME